MKKRLFSLLVVLCLMVGMAPAVTAATLDNGLYYQVHDSYVEITYYDGAATELVIPSEIDGLPVASIGKHAFDGCTYLTSVSIPNSVTSIGEYAFSRCAGLTNISLSSNVTSIGKYAFVRCSSLTSISLPSSVASIGQGAFTNCTSLTSISIPEGVTKIENFTFESCTSLTNIYFLSDAPAFGNNVFFAVTANAYYPINNATWTQDVMQNYGGTITWNAYTPHTHEYTTVVIAPTCTEQGYTTYTCSCGHSYMADYVDALGHDYADGTCTHCGEADPNHQKPAENPFTDVPAGSFYEDPVLWAVENGITNGSTADTFAPNDVCLRAHVVTFLHRAAKNPEPSTTNNPFTDVKTTDFFYKPVLWAVEKGITNGVSATRFGSYDVCNRAAVVTFLWRAAGEPEPKSTNNPFTDVKTTDFFYKPVLWAVEKGITNGIDATHFGPTADCNRAQVVTFLYRANN